MQSEPQRAANWQHADHHKPYRIELLHRLSCLFANGRYQGAYCLRLAETFVSRVSFRRR